MTLREMLTEAERLTRELGEHLDQSFIPKCHELSRLLRPINGEPPDLPRLRTSRSARRPPAFSKPKTSPSRFSRDSPNTAARSTKPSDGLRRRAEKLCRGLSYSKHDPEGRLPLVRGSFVLYPGVRWPRHRHGLEFETSCLFSTSYTGPSQTGDVCSEEQRGGGLQLVAAKRLPAWHEAAGS